MADSQKSKLIPIGILLMVLSFAAGPISRAIPGPLGLGSALLIDALRLGFFAGLTCLIIGALRQRKSKSASPQDPL